MSAVELHRYQRPGLIDGRGRALVAVTNRPQTWGRPLGLAEAMTDAAAFADRFAIFEDGPAVWHQLAELSRHYAFAGRHVHDVNIVARMITHGERRLLTVNTSDFQRFGAVIEVVNP